MKTTMKKPFSYNAAINTKDARESLFSIIHDDDKRRLVLSDDRYDSLVESGIKFFAGKAP
jgi:hypothetical protein